MDQAVPLAGAAPSQDAPGPSINIVRFVVGTLLFGRDHLEMLGRDIERYGDIYRYDVRGFVTHVLRHPAYVRHVLEAPATRYRRHPIYTLLSPVLGQGLLTVDEATWRDQRRMLQPAFARARMGALAELIAAEVDRHLAAWDAGPAKRTVDLCAEMSTLALSIAARTLFSTAVEEEWSGVGEALALFNEEFKRVTTSVPFLRIPIWVPLPRHERLRDALALLNRLVRALILARRRAPAAGADLMQLLLDARDPETGRGLDDAQLHDQVKTMLFAGHDTTALTLTWVWWLLAENPSIEESLHGDLPRLDVTRRVIRETLRLRPPAWGFSRVSVEPDVIAGYRIPARSTLVMCPYFTHRHPEFWPDPERADPDRFTDAAVAARPRGAYIPFGLGPHMCIGAPLALQAAEIAVSRIAARYRFRLATPGPVPLLAGVTLRPRDGLPVVMERR